MRPNVNFQALDLNVARARIALSLVTVVSIYVDPTTGGMFGIAPFMLIVLGLHLAYGAALYMAIKSAAAPAGLPAAWTVLDVLFATLLALSTEGPTSPAYAFFAFAIIATGCRFGLRATSLVTLSSVLVYLLTIRLREGAQSSIYLMRPAYLAITGYLIAFLVQERANFEARIRELQASAERERIARSLHDGYVQALASLNVRLAACRELLLKQRADEVVRQLGELRMMVGREYDEVRSYLRTLVDLDQQALVDSLPNQFDTQFRIEISFSAGVMVVEEVFQIVLEGIRNAWRHGRATAASVNVAQAAQALRIVITDDGKGFGQAPTVPWSIASRVEEFGGRLTIHRDQTGAHLEIEMPAGR